MTPDEAATSQSFSTTPDLCSRILIHLLKQCSWHEETMSNSTDVPATEQVSRAMTPNHDITKPVPGPLHAGPEVRA